MRVDQNSPPATSANTSQPRRAFHEVLAARAGTKPSAAASRPSPSPRTAAPAPRSAKRPDVAAPKRLEVAVSNRSAATASATLAAHRLERTLHDGRVVRAADETRETLRRAHTVSAESTREAECSRLLGSLERDLKRDAGLPARPESRTPAIDAVNERPVPLASPAIPEAGAAAAPTRPNDGAPVAASSRAEAIASMVERIEQSMKSGRPELTLFLGAGAAAENITIARTGRREVAVNVDARASRRAELREQLDDLGTALAARGLKLRILRVRRA